MLLICTVSKVQSSKVLHATLFFPVPSPKTPVSTLDMNKAVICFYPHKRSQKRKKGRIYQIRKKHVNVIYVQRLFILRSSQLLVSVAMLSLNKSNLDMKPPRFSWIPSILGFTTPQNLGHFARRDNGRWQ